MLTCKQATKVMSQAQDRPLSLKERINLRLHLMMCSGCSNFREQMGSIREAMRAYADGRANSGDREEDRGPR